MKQTFQFALIFAFALISSLCYAEIATVLTTADSGPGSLRDTIAAADPGDTIQFHSSLDGDTIDLISEILIDKPLYIMGNGVDLTFITGENGGNRIFRIESFSVVIRDIEFVKGRSHADAGAILIDTDDLLSNYGTSRGTGAPPVIMNCEFINNQANSSGSGGAISGFAPFDVIDCDFYNNYASSNGGAIAVQGGSFSDQSNGSTHRGSPDGVLIRGCGFYDNIADNKGGAISLMGSSTFIDNSVFMRNGAVFGGAIDMNMDDIIFANGGSVRGGMDGELIINRSVFEKDTAKYGGALSSFGGSLYQSTNGGSRGGPCFSSFDIEIDSSSFIDCDAKFAGGAIYNQLGLLVTNSSFERDTAGEIGGAIFTGEFSNDNAGNGSSRGGPALKLEVSNSSFTECAAFTKDNDGIRIIKDFSVTDGSSRGTSTTAFNEVQCAPTYGGAIATFGAENDICLVLDSVEMNHNSAVSGGGLFMLGGEGTITHSEFQHNRAEVPIDCYVSYSQTPGGLGGAICATEFIEGVNIFVSSTLEIYNSVFTENEAGYSGGAIYSNDFDDVSIENSTIDLNRACLTGGGISATTTGLFVDSCSIIQNTVGGCFPEPQGIIGANRDLQIDTQTNEFNTLPVGGGIAFIDQFAFNLSYQVTEPSRGSGNIALIVTNSDVSSNTAESGSGGGIHLGDYFLRVDSEIFLEESGQMSSGRGFNCYDYIIENCKINHNSAFFTGGGVSISGERACGDEVIIRDSEINYNRVAGLTPASIVPGQIGGGGGLYLGHIYRTKSFVFGTNAGSGSQRNLTDGNRGLFSNSPKVTMENTIMEGDSSIYGSGGGVLMEEGSILKMDSCEIRGCLAGDDGGGIAHIITSNGFGIQGGRGENGDYKLMINYSTIAENTVTPMAQDDMIIIDNSRDAGFFVHCGGGIFNQGMMNIVRSTISSNQANNLSFDPTSADQGQGQGQGQNNRFVESGGGGIGQSSQGVASITYSTIYLNSTDGYGGGILQTGELSMGGTIVAGNRAQIDGNDGWCVIQQQPSDESFGNNLIGDTTTFMFPLDTSDIGGSSDEPLDPKLKPLADNGGFTRTHLPDCVSPAVDAGNENEVGPDQRGEMLNGTSDIGSADTQADEFGVDSDGDGFCDDNGDCDDADPDVNPDVDERCQNGIDDNCNIEVDEQPCLACIPDASNNRNRYIRRVRVFDQTFTPLLNNPTGAEINGYGDYTSLSFPQSSIPFNNGLYFQLVPRGPRFAKACWKVWMDFNRNQIFDPSELIIHNSTNRPLIATATIPPVLFSFTDEPVLVRVSMSYGGCPQGPCGPVANGEVEDYLYGQELLMMSNNPSPLADNPKINKDLGIQGISVPELPAFVSVFPNPANDMLQVQIPGVEASEMILRLQDNSGKMVMQRMVSVEQGSMNTIQLDVSSIASGIYYLRVIGGDEPVMEKVVIQH